MNPLAIVGQLVGLVLDVAEDASEHDREQIRELLADAEGGLRSIRPNGPRIRALVEERRRARRETQT